jgi:AraC-like DNA-binding protein
MAHQHHALTRVRTAHGVTVEDWTWPPDAEPQDVHVHAEWQICQYLNEPGHYRRRGEREGVAPGQFALVPGGEAHRPEDDEVRLGARYRVWYFPEEMLQRVAADAASDIDRARRVNTVWSAPPLNRALAHLDEVLLDEESSLFADRIAAQLIGADPAWLTARALRETCSPRLEQARDYLCDNWHRPVPLTELAQTVGLSRSRLIHAFAAHHGLPPSAFGLRFRTDRARQAILAGASIAEAAIAHGFADQAHLTRCFRRFVGAAPGRYLRARGNFVQDRLAEL